MKFEYRITLGYLVVGCLWILFSDNLLGALIQEPEMITRLQTYKGWFYVIITGILLYLMLRNHLRKLRSAEQSAKDSDRLKTAFVQNISHEIRTPMTSIIGFTELLKEKGIDEPLKTEYLGFISASSNQLLNIVNEVLDISMIETGNKKINLATVSLNEITEDIYNTFKPAIRSEVKFALRNGLRGQEAIVITDGGRIKQVLGNLLNNAVKFVDSGHIFFGYSQKENEIEFFVEDTGIGIEEAVKEKIFNRFSKADTGKERLYEGLGLGLAISKGIVELLGGRIWLESKPGRGSTFYFTIPLNIASSPYIRETEPLNIKAPIHGITVLVVEDDASNRRYISEIFRGTGINVIMVTNGKEAVHACLGNSIIDVILMDLKMPVMDGYEATMEIRQIRPGIPIIAQSAFALNTEKEKAMQSGCTDYLAKPYKRDQLLEMISKHVPA
jgi:signal transduction histidine kinase